MGETAALVNIESTTDILMSQILKGWKLSASSKEMI